MAASSAKGPGILCHSPGRRAVTLLEVILVLAVLVMLAAVAWPSLDRSLADQRLRHAADMVRAQWAQAHVRAVGTGTQYHFRVELNGRRYWIEPADCGGEGAATLPAAGAVSVSGTGQSATGPRFLPDDLMFTDLKVEPPSRTEVSWPMGHQDDSAFAVAESLQPEDTVTFYPDGTCSAARLVLRNAYDRCVTVSLRGLTAVATVGEVVPVEEVLP